MTDIDDRPNHLEPIKRALPTELAMTFMEHVNRKGLKPWDDELELAAEVAREALAIRDFQQWFGAQVARVEALFGEAATKFDLAISQSMTRASDELTTDLRFAARELATSEFRAASAIRDEAIEREVKALEAATRRFVEAEQRVKARASATGEPSRPSAAPRGRSGWFSPPVAAAIAAALLIGLMLGMNLHGRAGRIAALDAPLHVVAASVSLTRERARTTARLGSVVLARG